MRRWIRHGWAGLAAACVLVGAACVDDNDLGEYCFVGASTCDPMVDPNCDFIIDYPDLMDFPDCRGGVCFKQSGYSCLEGAVDCPSEPTEQVKLQPYCSRACVNSSDCDSDGGGVNGCSAYVCQRQPDEWYEGTCLCACLDFIRDASGVPLSHEAFEAGDRA